MSDDFNRIGKSLVDQLLAERRAKVAAMEEARKKPEKISSPIILENCPECSATAVFKESFGLPIGQSAKRSLPDDQGIITVTCRVCEHIWYEDDMVKKIVVDTNIS